MNLKCINTLLITPCLRSLNPFFQPWSLCSSLLLMPFSFFSWQRELLHTGYTWLRSIERIDLVWNPWLIIIFVFNPLYWWVLGSLWSMNARLSTWNPLDRLNLWERIYSLNLLQILFYPCELIRKPFDRTGPDMLIFGLLTIDQLLLSLFCSPILKWWHWSIDRLTLIDKWNLHWFSSFEFVFFLKVATNHILYVLVD